MKIEIFDTKEIFHIRDKWEELTTLEYIYLCEQLQKVVSGEIPILEMQVNLLLKLTGLEIHTKKFSKEEMEQINFNIDQLSSNLDFMFSIEAGEFKIKSDFKKFFITELETGLNTFHGPRFELKPNGMFFTDIKAEEFIDAINFYSLFSQTNESKDLDFLIAILFRKNREVYDSMDTFDSYEQINDVKSFIKFGIYLQFAGFVKFIMTETKYAVLWDSTQIENTEKINIGMQDMIYETSKKGYGTTREIANLNIIELLDLRLKCLIENLNELKGLKKTDEEIASIMNMNIDTIKKLI